MLLNNIIKNIAVILLVLFSLISSLSYANDYVPEDLKKWEPWVLKDLPSAKCPFVYNNNNKKFCAYPDSLSIKIRKKSGDFQQVWNVYAESWITLPGDNEVWPLNVRVNNKKQPVIIHNNKPSIQLKKGYHRIKGDFKWQQRPKSLSIPQQTGIVKLTVDNKKIKLPDFRNGKVWLKSLEIKSSQNNKLDVQVFRKITDTIPMRITTHIKLDVSGQQRELTLSGALLEGFFPSAINSRLPSQIDRNGLLKIQISPGQWTVDVTSINTNQLTSISLFSHDDEVWPKNEVWVLDHKTHLRLIKVKNKSNIDPNQTQLPSQWKSLPAYSMQTGERLMFEVIKRGNPKPEPDQLSLRKRIWLDFDGYGFTVNDKITGKLSRQWRLNTAEMDLGQAIVNGKPQLITKDKEQQQGIEVRHGNLNLLADSRINTNEGVMSASGWDIDFNKVSATLYLPAGWKFMSLLGANSKGTWLKQWTLLDLFLVLITAVAVYKMFGMKWGVIALLALTLLWQENGAPQYIWINLILATSLLRVVTEGRFYKFLRNYRIISSVILVIIILPFIVNQVRTTLYPQLEFKNMKASNTSFSEYQSKKTDRVVTSDVMGMQEEIVKLSKSPSKISSAMPSSRLFKSKVLQTHRIDPDAMIQTGPGLPAWAFHQYSIDWDGPVRKDQNISMILLSPIMHAFFKVIQIVFLLLLAWCLLEFSSFKFLKLPIGMVEKSAVAAFVLSVFLTMTPTSSEAAFPPQKILDELKNELTKPPSCLPRCASIDSLSIKISSKNLEVRLRVHSQEDVLLPLPIPIKQWIPNEIMVDGKKTAGLVRKNDSTLWIHSSKGSHLINVSGRVDYLNQLQFSFPLKPHHISVESKSWSSEGMDADTRKITALTFLRIINKNKSFKNNKIAQSELPVYAEVTRKLELGLDWYVTTRVRGVSGTDYPIVFTVPLLQTESVVTDNIKVKDNHVVVTLNKNKRSLSWRSKLDKSIQIKLLSSNDKSYMEKWMLDASPIWHVDYKGSPVIFHQRQGNNWRPEWQPWPGEKIILSISRPTAVKGKTLTIDNSNLVLTPGEQITNAKLLFNIRSSLGGQHIIHLPSDIELQTVAINGQNIPIQNAEDGISLPLSPGQQKVEINWRQTKGISTIFHSPNIDLGGSSVNSTISLKPGQNRWVLFTAGPTIGPAILFWGMLIVITMIAYVLGRIKGIPLNSVQWVLLGLGLSASGPWGMVILAVCVFSLRARGMLLAEQTTAMNRVRFNLMQSGLMILVTFSVVILFSVIEQGLLGTPDMQIMGNGSNSYQLNWFSDRINNAFPEVTMISVPVYVYRLMMLAWSIWLAFSVIDWARWGWGEFTSNGYWKNVEKNSSKTTD